MISDQSVTVILLAGGTGSRMNHVTPKQFMSINGQLICNYSYQVFCSMPQVKEIVVVALPQYHFFFEQLNEQIALTFALPGERRQDSVFNGLQAIRHPGELICIHDAARPAITTELVIRTLDAAQIYGAAVPGIPLKFTAKLSDPEGFVKNTPDRSLLWEIQTPQVINYSLLVEGFQMANATGITVTDDASLIELLEKPVKIVQGGAENIKITTQDDLQFVEHYLKKGLNVV